MQAYKKNKDGLTPRQARFVEEYLIDFNGAAAARRAGYKTERLAAHKLLRKPAVAKAVSEGRARIAEKTELSAEFVRSFWKKAIEVCAQEVPMIGADGAPVTTKAGDAAYKFQDAPTLRNLLADVAKSLALFDPQENSKKEDSGTGVMRVDGIAEKDDWDNG